ncbi:MAG: CusA/CzcA family heavy metal efflux RND transporter [Bacteroidetes bacterium]|nr:MAG: CusA/CzcA family heavy metal efflux RND transporter [Bacteroidota bacterium]
MIDKLIAYSIRNKFVIGLSVLALIGWGVYSALHLPIDAVPDITNNQTQVITVSPNLATQEVEQFITYPVELAMQNLPGVEEIRSVSRFGLSVVTVVFRDDMGTYLPRQLVAEKLNEVRDEIPPGLGTPEMGPITTGLGEIYQYVLRPLPGYEKRYSPMELRTIQDWIVKRQLSGIPGVVEVNSIGGYLKQYEVAVDPGRLQAQNVTLTELLEALERSNQNTGGAYIEKTPNLYFIRSEGLAESLEDIGDVVVKNLGGVPLLVRDVAEVRFGHAPRFGALAMNGEGEVVGGLVLMLKGANSHEVTRRVVERVREVQKSLPEGVVIEPYLVRDGLVNRTIRTVRTNLIEGGLIVIFVLVLMLGNLRAGFIVASVIPLSMLFALGMMQVFGLSGNLMSLGAIDFGLIVDGAVIIVEGILFQLHGKRTLPPGQSLDGVVEGAARRLMRPASFGVLIILIVYLPILVLTGIEGKMFRPMALTVCFALLGALLLSLTYVPMMSALLLRPETHTATTLADRIMKGLQAAYAPAIRFALQFKGLVVTLAVALFALSLWQFSRMGGEFIPTLEEGDLAVQQILPPGSSLSQSVEIANLIARKLRERFPEVRDVVARIGSAEIPTDPMPIELGDLAVTMAPREEWVSASSREEMFERFEEVLREIPGINYEFSQPIQLRFNELLTGARSDIALKIFGEDLDTLYELGTRAESIIRGIEGVGSVRTEQITGMPQIVVRYRYDRLARYGVQVADVNRVLRTAFAGERVGTVFEGERRFDLVVRLHPELRRDLEDVRDLLVPLADGGVVPLRELASIAYEEGPMQISRDDTHRRVVVGINASGRDTESLVEEIRATLEARLPLPPGYYLTFGGQFEHLQEASRRLAVAVPLALGLIFLLLYFAFGSATQALLIFSAVPLAAIGGVWSLELRGMPFSISAGVGFIALFGVAVLNGIVLLSYFNQLEREGWADIHARILEGTRVRLRPVLLTATVAALGFLPMALSTSAGAEVQRPLATVVIGGLLSATLLTLVVLPVLYSWWARWRVKRRGKATALPLLLLFALPATLFGQRALSLEEALERAETHHPALQAAALNVRQNAALEGSGFDPDPTGFYYSGDGLGQGGGFAEHSFGTRQNFLAPRAYRMRNEVLQGRTALAEARRSLQLQAVRAEVTETFVEWQSRHLQARLYADFDSLLSDFHAMAERRVQTGETTPLESLHARHLLETLRLDARQNDLHLQALEERLRLLTGLEEALQPDPGTPARFPLPGLDPPERHPLLQFHSRRRELRQVELERTRTELLPSFSGGYAYQIFSGVKGLHSVSLGVQVPLFRKAERKRLEAARLGVELAEKEAEAARLRLDSRRVALWNELQTLDARLEYLDGAGSALAAELLRTGALQYRQGEIGYLEYGQALQQALALRLDYFATLLERNRIAARIRFLQTHQN